MKKILGFLSSLALLTSISLSTSACIKITNTVLNNKSISLASKVVNLSLTGKNSEFSDQITNYSKLLNLKVVTKKDSSIVNASYNQKTGMIIIKALKLGSTTISISAEDCSTVLIKVVVTKAKNLTPPIPDASKVVKKIGLNTRWGIIDGNKPINFIITNNLLLSDLKITSNNKNISVKFESKTGNVLVYSNNGLGYWAKINIEASNAPSTTFFVFVLNSKYWKEEVTTIATGIAVVATVVGVSMYEIYKIIEEHINGLPPAVKPAQDVVIDLNKIIVDQVLRENIESQFQADLIDGHKLKESFIKSIPFFSFTGTRRIKNIEGIQYFSGLTFLNLANCSISDLSPLSKLTNLTNLNLWNNNISNLSPLSSLTNLTSLNLWENKISDLSALKNLKDLKDLFLNNNEISDLSPLNSLKNLTSLYLSNNQISDVTPIASLTKLTILELSYNRIPNTDAAWAPVHNLPSNPQGKQAWDSIDVRNSQGKTD